MKQRRFVIGDVHGCFKTLEKLLFVEFKFKKNDKLFFLGDLIDRGPRVKDTLEFVYDLYEKGQANVVRGNHEQMLLNALEDPFELYNWFYNGSERTLSDFGVNHPSEIPKKFINFLSDMPYYIEFEDFVLVHGDLDFTAEDPFSNTYAMIWGRSTLIIPEKIQNRKLIVGHTPTPLQKIIKSIQEWKIFLDGGCVYINYPVKGDLGYLCGFELNSKKLYYTKNVDF
ncbi:MAG: serine/threonine protein phosphatase [Ignavibacteria bacterium]|nr:serine/threonine protein phosphatase [Ignavibacteria bacterium]